MGRAAPPTARTGFCRGLEHADQVSPRDSAGHLRHLLPRAASSNAGRAQRRGITRQRGGTNTRQFLNAVALAYLRDGTRLRRRPSASQFECLLLEPIKVVYIVLSPIAGGAEDSMVRRQDHPRQLPRCPNMGGHFNFVWMVSRADMDLPKARASAVSGE